MFCGRFIPVVHIRMAKIALHAEKLKIFMVYAVWLVKIKTRKTPKTN
jgi:hypothetical protein